MKFKKCWICILICVFCAGLCIGSVISSYNLYYKSQSPIISSGIAINFDLSAIATFFTGLIAIIIAFISPKIQKKNNDCSFDLKITDNFPYYNATNYKFYDFNEKGIFQKSYSTSETFIYRLGIITKRNPSHNTVVTVGSFRRQGDSHNIYGFLPMRLRWSYKDNYANQKDIIIEKEIYPKIEHYCDFCFVKKSPQSKDYFLSLCGEYSGQTGKSICNCIFDSGIYEAEIIVASENCQKPQKYIITFNFTCCYHTNKDGHPIMFKLLNIQAK